MKVTEIDFDNAEQVNQLKNEKVEISVGVLAYLLNYFYTGGGEPNLLNERLAEVLDFDKE